MWMTPPPGDINLETDPRPSPAFAVLLDVPFTQRVSLVPEVAFVQRGYTYKSALLSVFQSERLMLDYLDFALLAKFHFAEEPARPYLLLGPTIGRMIGARAIPLDNAMSGSSGVVLDPDLIIMQRVNMGLCGGGGFAFTAGTTWLFLEGRYHYGLSNIWNGVVLADVNGQVIGELNSFDRSWQINVGWVIPLQGRPVPEN